MIVLAPTTIPTLISTVTTLAKTIGPAIVKYAPIVIETAAKNLPLIIRTVEAVGVIANITRPTDNVNEIGAKAMQADKKPENFDAINEYIDYLRNDVIVDVSKLSNAPVDVMARQAIGTSVILQGLSSKLGTEVSWAFVSKAAQMGIESSVIWQVLKTYSDNGLNADEFTQFMDDELSIVQADKHCEALVKAHLELDPTMSIEQAEDAVLAMR